VLRATLDTNTLDRIDEIRAAIAGRAVEIAITAVTTREKRDAGVRRSRQSESGQTRVGLRHQNQDRGRVLLPSSSGDRQR